jgi:hypothetical protein
MIYAQIRLIKNLRTDFDGLIAVRPKLQLVAMGLVALLLISPAQAEPYLAVYKGMTCSSCHTGPAGGGKRTVYGNVYSQTEMPAQRIGNPEDQWTGQISKWFGVGGNLRGEYRYVDTPNQSSTSEFDVRRGTVYLEASVIPNRLSVYVDQKLAPDNSENREAYVQLKSESGKYQLIAGKFYLPYGLRLEDDTAYIRESTGINFNNPDEGVQVSFESGRWSTQASITNGSGGGPETDDGKQFSWIGQYITRNWRVGASLNVNDSDGGDRDMQNIFVGARTGPVVWLAEVDLISDDIPGENSQDGWAGLIEGNWLYRQGHNLKVTYEYFDPDDDVSEDQQVRWSVLWEYTPIQFLQTRAGARFYDGIPQVDSQNRDELFVELHGFF